MEPFYNMALKAKSKAKDDAGAVRLVSDMHPNYYVRVVKINYQSYVICGHSGITLQCTTF